MGAIMNFNKRENYLKVIRAIFADYPEKHQEIIQDFHDWLDDRYTMPYTKELRAIITKLKKEE